MQLVEYLHMRNAAEPQQYCCYVEQLELVPTEPPWRPTLAPWKTWSQYLELLFLAWNQNEWVHSVRTSNDYSTEQKPVRMYNKVNIRYQTLLFNRKKLKLCQINVPNYYPMLLLSSFKDYLQSEAALCTYTQNCPKDLGKSENQL